jgi:hypothetical protein
VTVQWTADEIASAVGLTHRQTFALHLRHLTGYTPIEIRMRYREGKSIPQVLGASLRAEESEVATADGGRNQYPRTRVVDVTGIDNVALPDGWVTVYSGDMGTYVPGIIRYLCDQNGPVMIGRDGEIRTRDPLHPMQVRYQAAPRPDFEGGDAKQRRLEMQ